MFDGFPRTIAQAQALDRMLESKGNRIDAVVELKVDDDALVGRVENRIRENPGSVRPDDNPETLRKPQPSGTAGSAGAPQKHLSLVARRKIAAAQRARWAKVRAQQKRAA